MPIPSCSELSLLAPIAASWRSYGFAEPRRAYRMPGQSVHELAQSIPHLPRDFRTRGRAFIGEVELPRERRPDVRPKPSAHAFLDVPLQNRRGKGGLLATIAMIALLIVTAPRYRGGALGVFGGFRRRRFPCLWTNSCGVWCRLHRC